MSLSIDISESAGVRYLHFGSEWVQGAMRIRKPFALELAYTREMMAGLLLRDAPWPRNALLIGLGAGSLTKFIHRHYPATRIDVVEIEERVVAVAQHFFELPEEDQRLHIHIADGTDYVLNCDKHYDLILLDGFDEDARAGALDTEAFYLAARCRLSSNGLMAANLFGRSRGFKASLSRIDAAFEGRCIAFPSCDSGNVIAFAAVGDAVKVSLTEMRERALELKQDSGLDLLPTVSRLEQAGSCPGGHLRL